MLAVVAWTARFGHIASAMLLFGASLFPLYAGVQSWPPRMARFLPLALASILFLGILLTASLTLVDLTRDTASLVSMSELGGFFLETAFEPVWLARLVFSTAVFAVALVFAISSSLMALRYRQHDFHRVHFGHAHYCRRSGAWPSSTTRLGLLGRPVP